MIEKNTSMNNLKNATNYKHTENGALAHKKVENDVYQMFAVGGAYRNRSDEDCILLFKNAIEEDKSLALKCLFYLRDCRGGQGERRFFRVCFRWLANEYPKVATRNFKHMVEYGRWDDILYTLVGTPLETKALDFIQNQLTLDLSCKTPSLLAKWLPSENASSEKTRKMANTVRKYLGLSHKEYRKVLSMLREKIKVLERLMSANRWDEIEFDKIPSKAGLIYKNAFARRDIIAQKYEDFAKSKDTKVNADVLYPYEVVHKAITAGGGLSWGFSNHGGISDTDRAILEKYWNNLPDYFNGKPSNILCVVDTSASMWNSSAAAPINVAISLGMYCAERASGAFKNHYISFSRNPQLIKVEGVDFVDKVYRIYRTNLCENTNLIRTFNMLKDIAKRSNPKDIPDTIVVISDMQIDQGSNFRWNDSNKIETEMESMRREWEREGLEMPKLVYWNVDARGEANILDNGPNVSYVSGFSPAIFEAVLTGKTGWDLCLDKLLSDRYKVIY